jgi:hypothetical protein
MPVETPTAEERSRRIFEASTPRHEMTVLHEADLYRHVRFAQPVPHSWNYAYSLVTWPGYLSISGDLESFTFCRTADMFRFFASGQGINPHYWGEKLVAPRGRAAVQVYSPELYRKRVGEWLADELNEIDDDRRQASLREAVREQLLDEDDIEHSEDAAYMALRDFRHAGVEIPDVTEWDLRDWDHHFLVACWAIRRGVEAYWAAKDAAKAPVAPAVLRQVRA